MWRFSIRRTAAGIPVVLAVAAATVLVQLGTAGPAAAVTGMEVVWANSNVVTAAPHVATAQASCPAGKRVLGGGGGVNWSVNDYPYDIVLTRMQPVHPLNGNDSFIVTGERIPTGTTPSWSVRSYAICADPLPGLYTAFAFSTLSSSSSQRAEAVCTNGRKVIGTGAYIYNSGGQVGLQVMRSSDTGTLSYAQGHEDANGYSGDWYVMSLAVCADPIAGYQIVGAASPEDDSESLKSADAECPAGKTMYGGGGSTGFAVTGAASLRWLTVDIADDLVHASFIENTATTSDWDWIMAQVICAN